MGQEEAPYMIMIRETANKTDKSGRNSCKLRYDAAGNRTELVTPQEKII